MSHRHLFILLAVVLATTWRAYGQQPVFSHEHGFYEEPFALTIALPDEASRLSAPAGVLPVGLNSGAGEGTPVIRYTLDGSEPTAASTVYGSGPLTIGGTAVVRAAAFDGDVRLSPVTTATYLFVDDILSQTNTPEGYPDTWGSYATISGTATADYEMDPEMTGDPTLRLKIAEGLKSLPVVSIVTDPANLFSHENDSVRGGIYIFTGPPVGDPTGHGWTRPASVEMFGMGEGFTAGCGLRLHGGHGRLAEKNPKHSFRLVFKEKYGPKTLKYPLFGEEQPAKFDQLVLRCHFGNSWQHWDEGNRQKAQYCRDVWARSMQRRMGRTSVNALYVNLFINGMYWGLYNLAERVDRQFGKDHIGGEKDGVDVVKIEEDGGNHLEATEGTIDAWNLMTTMARIVGGQKADTTPEEAYAALQDSLLDIPSFIDYMILNQYGGNTDWDHHNWYAIRSRGAGEKGFRMLCWDSEIIEENVNENVVGKNNGNSFPTGIFHNLLHNEDFARQYVRRAKELLAPGGLLGRQSVVQLWDSLHSVIGSALYAEAARWGDYRRDVHRYTSRGQLYTVDGHYAAERNRLLTQYFPYRSDIVLAQITAFAGIDDFEPPKHWQRLTAQQFMEWDGNAADSQPTGRSVNVDWNMGTEAGGGTAIAGFGNVEFDRYADLSAYEGLALRGSGGGLRVLANRLVAHGPYKQIILDFSEDSPYWDSEHQALILPLADLAETTTNEGKRRRDDFVHVHVLKVDWSSRARVSSAWLIPKEAMEGDVNGDGAVNVADISAVIDVMAGSGQVTSTEADVNGDGAVNVADISAVIDVMAGGK